MRIGSSILLRNGQCVQSYSWNAYRPLGKLQSVVTEIEAYESDEISIIRPVRFDDDHEDIVKDIEVLKTLRCMTPISFGGGIRNIQQLELIDDLPIERIVFTTAFVSEDSALLDKVIEKFGHQSIQCLLPVREINGVIFIHNLKENSIEELDSSQVEFISEYANEIIIYDCVHEGRADTFNMNLINIAPFDKGKLVISGGIGHGTIEHAQNLGIASVLIENRTLHNEYSITDYRCASKL